MLGRRGRDAAGGSAEARAGRHPRGAGARPGGCSLSPGRRRGEARPLAFRPAWGLGLAPLWAWGGCIGAPGRALGGRRQRELGGSLSGSQGSFLQGQQSHPPTHTLGLRDHRGLSEGHRGCRQGTPGTLKGQFLLWVGPEDHRAPEMLEAPLLCQPKTRMCLQMPLGRWTVALPCCAQSPAWGLLCSSEPRLPRAPPAAPRGPARWAPSPLRAQQPWKLAPSAHPRTNAPRRCVTWASVGGGTCGRLPRTLALTLLSQKVLDSRRQQGLAGRASEMRTGPHPQPDRRWAGGRQLCTPGLPWS